MTEPSTVGKKAIWTGRVLSVIPIGMMLFSAAMKLHPSPQVVQFAHDHLGYPETAFVTLAILEISCVVLYAIPQTAVLGAILMTGYLGGAIASHFRVGDPPIPPAILALLAWGGLYLRDVRLRELIPLRKPATVARDL